MHALWLVELSETTDDPLEALIDKNERKDSRWNFLLQRKTLGHQFLRESNQTIKLPKTHHPTSTLPHRDHIIRISLSPRAKPPRRHRCL